MQPSNTQGIAGLAPQGGAPNPNSSSPMAAVGSVEDRVAAYRGNPEPLQQRYAMSQDLLDLLALQKIKSEKENAARHMQLQMQQQQAAQGLPAMTIAQQREKEVMDLTKDELAQQRAQTANQQVGEQEARMQEMMGGIAAAPGAQNAAEPKAMASGGIVTFSGGGTIKGESELDIAKERARNAYNKLMGFGQVQRSKDPSGFTSAKKDYEEADAELQRAQDIYEKELAKIGINRPGGKPGEFRELMVGKPPPAPAKTPATAPAAEKSVGKPKVAAPPLPPGLGGEKGLPPAQGGPLPPSMPSGTSGTPTAGAPVQKSDFEKVVEGGITSGINIDPNAERDAQAKWAQGIMALTPEQRAVYQQGIAEREQMYKEQYDPKRQAEEKLRRFLLGAGGRRWGVLGGGAQASMDYEAQQNAQRIKDFEDLQKAREAPIGIERSGIPSLLNLGSSAYQSAQNVRERAIGSGATYTIGRENAENRRQQNELRQQIEKISEEAKKEKDPLKAMEMTARVKKLHMETINDEYDRGVKALFPSGLIPDKIPEDKVELLKKLRETRDRSIALLEEKLGLSTTGGAKDDITKYKNR